MSAEIDLTLPNPDDLETWVLQNGRNCTPYQIQFFKDLTIFTDILGEVSPARNQDHIRHAAYLKADGLRQLVGKSVVAEDPLDKALLLAEVAILAHYDEQWYISSKALDCVNEIVEQDQFIALDSKIRAALDTRNS